MIERVSTTLAGITRRAVFSDCEKYRYELSIVWDDTKPRAAWLMMNPSTATELVNDPTVERCERRFARNPAFGGVEILNVFAWRETDSDLLEPLIKKGVDIVGPANDETIVRIAKRSAMVICAWGQPGNLNGRGTEVRKMLDAAGVDPYVLVLNKDGTPQHPLYIGYDVVPVSWSVAKPRQKVRSTSAIG